MNEPTETKRRHRISNKQNEELKSVTRRSTKDRLTNREKVDKAVHWATTIALLGILAKIGSEVGAENVEPVMSHGLAYITGVLIKAGIHGEIHSRRGESEKLRIVVKTTAASLAAPFLLAGAVEFGPELGNSIQNVDNFLSQPEIAEPVNETLSTVGNAAWNTTKWVGGAAIATAILGGAVYMSKDRIKKTWNGFENAMKIIGEKIEKIRNIRVSPPKIYDQRSEIEGYHTEIPLQKMKAKDLFTDSG